MRNIKYFAAIFALIFISCSTVYKTSQKGLIIKPKEWNDELKTLNISANVTSKYHEESNSGYCRLILAGTDSLSLKITGPFEILVGRLYADIEYFVFYDAFNNQIFEGKPTAKNMKRATMVPLSFDEFIRLLRCETPTNPSEYSIDENYNKADGVLYKNPSNKEYIEYALYSSDNNDLIRYQRKLRTGKLILDLNYKDYETIDGIRLSKYLIFNFPEIDTQVDMQVASINVNKDINKTLGFTIPDGVKVHKIE